MNQRGPIIIIEDDLDDQELLTEVFRELAYENPIRFFTSGYDALDYLNTTHEKPFIILSDINLPKLSGIELRDKIMQNELLRLKCIPYLFFTTAASQQAIVDAYSNSAQGFFVKPTNYNHLVTVIRKIIDYWLECRSPNYISGV
ncbi:MAG TPA: response regulator [Flavitalea sp.]|nr:response regulator [Flavitalea sp.]